LAAIELYCREQWIEKGFVLNISRFIFDSIILILNCRLFLWLFTSGQFPLYLLGESFDTFIKLYKSAQLFIKSRTLVSQLKSLPNVDLDVPANRQGVDTTCIICLEEMHLAKRLRCGHIFHLSCLRRWIEQNVKCPTCRSQIVLDSPQLQRPAGNNDQQDNNRRGRLGDGARDGQGAARQGRQARHEVAQRRDVRLLMRQQ
jgi:E3 ubiquitin-protein ligase synoviolin